MLQKCLHPLLVAALLASTTVLGQKLPVDSETKKITYSEVIEVSGATKDDLYKRAKEWFVTGTGNTKLALEFEDPENGKQVGKVNNPVKVNNPPLNNKFEVGSVGYNVTIVVKDSKYKYVFTDFVHDSDGRNKVISCGELENKKSAAKSLVNNDMPTNWQWNKIKEVTEEAVLAQIIALKKVMSGSGTKDTDF